MYPTLVANAVVLFAIKSVNTGIKLISLSRQTFRV